ncbi:MAG TPA: Gfo/Idh/MocA family oxidoreductase [Chthoniobacter sp.]
MGIYNHAAAYRACPDTELVAICDTDPEKLTRAGERWKVTGRYTDARELLSQSAPEVISICTPDAMHFEGVKAALSSPSVRGVLAEKPLALEAAEAEELAEMARARGVALAVNYSRRYSTGHAELREWIRGGGLGKIVTVGGFYTKGTLHNGSHWFDLARWMVGEISEVTGFDMLGETNPDPTLDAILRFENGATGHLQAFNASAGTLFEMDVLGTKGRVRVVEPAGQFAKFHLNESRTFSGYRVFEAGDVWPARNSDTVLHAVEDLIACVKNGNVPRCSADDGVAAVRVARAVRDSARLGRPIDLQKNV